MNPLVHCPKCKTALAGAMFNRADFAPCPSCRVPLQSEVYPALFRPLPAAPATEAIMVEGEASCFYHPQKKAILPCEGCGRFLCALCDCEHQGRHFCPACLEAGRTKGRIASLEINRVRYDRIALLLAVGPILFFFISVLTAPIALYISIRYWKSPLGLTQRSRWRFVVAMVIALLQISAWVLIFISR